MHNLHCFYLQRSTKEVSEDAATAAAMTTVSGTDGDRKKETAGGARPSQVTASAINGKMSAEYFKPPPSGYIQGGKDEETPADRVQGMSMEEMMGLEREERINL